ncbi:SdpI family protein [Hyphomonas sp. FCG-A18]|uniref:SdpI family protein n=1 Tax=Hyphomonas sp. FCG-A18 TaxID=3080019 RepID=UPI002B3155BC|nr:SdpI family protein [Hyphomonas sp. FCG-A18]
MKTAIRNGLIASGLAIATMLGVIAWVWMALPEGEQIPLHWNAAGEADRWGSKREAMFGLAVMPVVVLFTTILLAVVPKLDPRRANLEKSAKTYGIVWVAVMVLLAGVSVGIGWLKVSSVSTAAGPDVSGIPFVRFVMAGTALMFIVLGNYLPKTRPNWFLGIRTPWTLSSDEAWEKTHRLGGRLFMLVGLVGLVIAFVLDGLALAFAVPAMVLTVTAICFIYSFLVWRGAADKQVESDYII